MIQNRLQTVFCLVNSWFPCKLGCDCAIVISSSTFLCLFPIRFSCSFILEKFAAILYFTFLNFSFVTVVRVSCTSFLRMGTKESVSLFTLRLSPCGGEVDGDTSMRDELLVLLGNNLVAFRTICDFSIIPDMQLS